MPVNPKNGVLPFSGQGGARAHNARMGSEKGKPKRVRTRPVNDEVNKRIIGNNLRRILDDSGLTQEAFATELGIKHRALQNWLGGVSYPQGDGVLQLAQMGYDLNFLYLGIGPMRRQAAKRRTETEQEHQKMATK